jgi:hypothetical protein
MLHFKDIDHNKHIKALYMPMQFSKYVIYKFFVCLHGDKHIIVLFVETPRKFITAINVINVINLRGVSTNKTIKYVILNAI